MTHNASQHDAESSRSAESPKRPGSAAKPVICSMAVVGLLTIGLYSPAILEQLLLGWLEFPFRVWPQVTVDWPAAAVGGMCTAAFLIGLHWMLRWFCQAGADQPPISQSRDRGPQAVDDTTSAVMQGKREPVLQLPRGWTMKLTLLCGLSVFLAFAAGTALIGATHQVVWLATSPPGDAAAPQVVGMIARADQAAHSELVKNNLKQLGFSVHNYHDTYDAFPPGGTMDERGRLLHGWAIYLAGFAWYSSEGIDFTAPWNAPPNDRLYRCAIEMFFNPAIPQAFDEEGYGLSHLAGNVHVFPIVMVPRGADESRESRPAASASPIRLSDLASGTSQTLLIGEVATNFKPWAHPANLRDPTLGIGRHPDGFGGPLGNGGAQFLMADGSVRFVSNDIDPEVLNRLAKP
jgi:prepilin-type processing-associated H-X9-DG protein